MIRFVEATVFFIFSATLLTQGAVILAVIAGLAGILSFVIVTKKINELDVIAKKQNVAVEKLDSLVGRIEEVVKQKET